MASRPLDAHCPSPAHGTSRDYRKAVLVKKRVVNTYSRAFPRQVFDKHHFLTPDTPVVGELELPSHLFRESSGLEESAFNSRLAGASASGRLGGEPDTTAKAAAQETTAVYDGRDKENDECSSKRRRSDADVSAVQVELSPRHKQSTRPSHSKQDREEDGGEPWGGPTKLRKLRLRQQEKANPSPSRKVQAGRKRRRRGGNKGSKGTRKQRKCPVTSPTCAEEDGDKIIANGKRDEAISSSMPARNIRLASALSSKENDDNLGVHSTDSPGILGAPNNLDTVSMEMTCETLSGASRRLSEADWENRTLKLGTQVLVTACNLYTTFK